MRSCSITTPHTELDLAEVRTLFTQYAESLGFSLAYQGFATELAELPGNYAPPTGALLLARVDGEAAGCVALRQLAPDTCEMKRLYVKDTYRGVRVANGDSIGRVLAIAVTDEARRLGYRRLRLDTIAANMAAAVKLYRAMGFVDIAPYYDTPIPGTVFMELAL